VRSTEGMIVICAGTTGYSVTMDLRYYWMRQKRFQGSHFHGVISPAFEENP
jgi:crotonyl-CoA carboxylase/reductase